MGTLTRGISVFQVTRSPDHRIPSGFSSHFGPPPARAYEQKPPIVKELRLFALKCVADELEYPPENKQARGIDPKEMNENTHDEEHQRDHDEGNAKGMAKPVHRMLMAARILRNPLFVAASA